jgi:hypothetical protein
MSHEQEFGPWKVCPTPFSRPLAYLVYRTASDGSKKIDQPINPHTGRAERFRSASHAYGWILTQGMRQPVNQDLVRVGDDELPTISSPVLAALAREVDFQVYQQIPDSDDWVRVHAGDSRVDVRLRRFAALLLKRYGVKP